MTAFRRIPTHPPEEEADLTELMPTTTAARKPTLSRGRALLVATRPAQWIKNLLVFAAPGAAGLLGHPAIVGRTAAATGIFLVASAGTYLVNDAIDAPSDRVHPRKQHRPVASGALSPEFAIGAGAVMVTFAVVGAALLAGLQLTAVLSAYLINSLAYTLWLKRVPVVELGSVSAGFVLRAVAGGAALHIPISPWFAIVTSSAALLVVAGKRSAEINLLGPTGPQHRRVLGSYSTTYLRTVRMVAASVTIISFCLWAFERAAHIDARHFNNHNIYFELAIIPFVLGVLSVEHAIDSGEGGAPEDLVIHNHTIQSLGLICIALLALGIYT